MKVIALTGLVSVEKIDAAKILAAQAMAQGQSVLVLDAVARLTVDLDATIAPVLRIDDELAEAMPRVLRQTDADVVIVATSEHMHPEAIFTVLDGLYSEFPQLELEIIALIDTRTCDCFPQTRAAFESFADTVIALPANLEEVLI